MDKLTLEATGVPLQQLPGNAVEPERDGRGMFHFVPPTLVKQQRETRNSDEAMLSHCRTECVSVSGVKNGIIWRKIVVFPIFVYVTATTTGY